MDGHGSGVLEGQLARIAGKVSELAGAAGRTISAGILYRALLARGFSEMEARAAIADAVRNSMPKDRTRKSIRPSGFTTLDVSAEEEVIPGDELAGLALLASCDYDAEARAQEEEIRTAEEETTDSDQEQEDAAGLAVHLRGSPEDTGPQVTAQAEMGLAEARREAEEEEDIEHQQEKRAPAYSEALVQAAIENNTGHDGEVSINGVVAEVSAKIPGVGKKARAARDQAAMRAKQETIETSETTRGIRPF